MRRTLVLVGILAAFVSATALAGTGDPVPATVTLILSAEKGEYGESIAAMGWTTPSVAGDEIVLELGSGSSWLELARTTTFASGTFFLTVTPPGGGLLRVRSVGTGAVSAPVALSISPKVEVTAARGVAFLGAKVRASILPATYSGTVTVTVKRVGKEVAQLTAGAANGRLQTSVPVPGPGRYTVVLTFPETVELAPTFGTARIVATARNLAVGSRGRDVRALQARLAELQIRVPATSAVFGSELVDAVIAFQKAYRLSRTGVVGPETWRALARAKPVSPRHRAPALHIEVDKTRQILMVVRNGKVVAVLPVSSGATGNTPEGKHQIRWKALATTTWLGPAILYRTMTFYGNSFAIHGFPSVPAYPASHGCVRIPIWAADWLYQGSSVGETVYVYS